MGSFTQNVGILSIILVITHGYRKFLLYQRVKRLGFFEDEKVYKAADAFAHGAPSDDVKAILVSCVDFNKEAAEKILSRSIPHRADKDGGYRAFIKSVNKVLGANVYGPHLHTFLGA